MAAEAQDVLAIKESDKHLADYGLNQIRAAPYTHQVINNLELVNQDASLMAVKETDIYQLRRGLCLPCAAATCINKVKEKRLIGDKKGELRVGDFFKLVLPFHGSREIDTRTGENFSDSWLVVTLEGDVYHHAIIAFAEALGVTAKSVKNFKSITEFLPIIEQKGAVAVSLDNRFVIEQTLRNDPELVVYEGDPELVKPKILIEETDGYDYREFQEGRHVVALLGFNGNRAVINDSFFLPQMKGNSLMELEVATVDHYLKYRSGELPRGIVFSSDSQVERLIKPEFLSSVVVPGEKVATIRRNLRQYFEPVETSLAFRGS